MCASYVGFDGSSVRDWSLESVFHCGYTSDETVGILNGGVIMYGPGYKAEVCGLPGCDGDGMCMLLVDCLTTVSLGHFGSSSCEVVNVGYLIGSANDGYAVELGIGVPVVEAGDCDDRLGTVSETTVGCDWVLLAGALIDIFLAATSGGGECDPAFVGSCCRVLCEVLWVW